MVEARDANDNITVREVDVTVSEPPPWFASALGCSAGGMPGLGAGLALVLLGRRRRG
jgi:uncharacterized protein (TIGR03382 family)